MDMKKNLALFTALALLTSGLAFALPEGTNTKGVGAFGTSFMRAADDGSIAYTCSGIGAGVQYTAKVSANVNLSLQKNATDGSTYLAATYHTSGNKYYATASGDSRIYMKEIGTETTPAAPPTIASAPTVAVDWAGWTAVK